jgi:hypothetical protein
MKNVYFALFHSLGPNRWSRCLELVSIRWMVLQLITSILHGCGYDVLEYCVIPWNANDGVVNKLTGFDKILAVVLQKTFACRLFTHGKVLETQ